MRWRWSLQTETENGFASVSVCGQRGEKKWQTKCKQTKIGSVRQAGNSNSRLNFQQSARRSVLVCWATTRQQQDLLTWMGHQLDVDDGDVLILAFAFDLPKHCQISEYVVVGSKARESE